MTIIVTPLKEENHAPVPKTDQSLPNPTPTRRITLNRLWEAFPEVDRQKTLQTLSRIVVEQLYPAPPTDKEVCNENG